MMNQHIVFGAGLIGTYLGAILQLNQSPLNKLRVTLLGRTNKVPHYNSNVQLTDYDGGVTNIDQLNYVDAINNNSKFDVIWLTVKCCDVKSSIAQIKLVSTSSSIILCCQNGIGSEKIIKQAFPNNLVLRVMVPFNVVEVAKGHLHKATQGQLVIEKDQNGKAQKLQSMLSHPMLPVLVNDNMDAVMWAKLQLNLSNGVNAIADMPVKTMLLQKCYRLQIANLMDELLAVVKKKNLTLPKLTAVPASLIPRVLRLPTWLFKLVANKMLAIDPKARLSMWWDIKNGKPTEIDFLNGAVIKAAKELGVDYKYNQLMVEKIKQLEKI